MDNPARHTRAAGFLAIALACVLAVGALTVGAPGAFAGDVPTALLPDLVVRPIRGVHITYGVAGRSLRFDTIVGNRGAGPAELFPDAQGGTDCDADGDPLNDRVASQRVFGDNEPDGVFTRGLDDALTEDVIGCFIFHPKHDHWHFEDFARYELKRVHTDEVLRSAEKVSFCLTDTGTFGDVPGTTTDRFYRACDADVTMGLSVGWFDLYGWSLAGQELSIRGVEDGRYASRMTVDPADHIEESNEAGNNGRSTVVKIDGGDASDLDRRCPGEPR